MVEGETAAEKAATLVRLLAEEAKVHEWHFRSRPALSFFAILDVPATPSVPKTLRPWPEPKSTISG